MIHKRDKILEEEMPPRRRFSLTGSPPGCDVVESSAATVARAPMSQYNFVDTVEAGHGLIHSHGHDTRTIARFADKAEDVEDDDDDPEEDPKEDPSEEHEPKDEDEDPEEDPNEEHEPKDEDTKEPSKGSDETEPFEDDKIAVTPPPSRHRRARISVKPQTPMAASTQALIDAFAPGSSLFPLPPTSPAYDQAQLGHRATMIHKRDKILEEEMPPRRRFALTGSPPGCDVVESSAATVARAPRSQYNFVDTVEAGHGLIHSPGHDTRTIARFADKAEDVSYVRALQASERKMMTFIEELT
nr:hypothetical protein [Tanacetum cinerariifolium]